MQGTTKRTEFEKVGKIISIHVPYTGNDFAMRKFRSVYMAFQSTFPMQGTTI